MEIVENTVVKFNMPSDKLDLITNYIEKSEVLNDNGKTAEVAVYWGIDEMQHLVKVCGEKVPSPISRDYEWPDEKLIEQAFLRTLARQPNSKELEAARERISGKSGEARMEGLCDVIWALVNTREFLLNH